jgi:cell wall-associated NlpC family hydrolase
MAAHRTTSSRRILSVRRTAVALAVGAGVVLTPLPAFAASSTSTAATQILAPNATAQAAVNTAMAQVGKPYAWAGAGPNAFDCSGLAQYAFKAARITLPHSTGSQAKLGTPVARTALKPGDLVFFYGGGHVGIYIGNDQVVHAPTAGDVVKVTKIAYMPFSSARRVA